MDEKRWTVRGARDAVVGATVRMGGAVSQGAAQSASRAAEIASPVSALIAGIEGPAVPLRETWSAGLGNLLRDHPALPAKLRGVAPGLNRLGHLRLSADAIDVDGEEVPWERIEEITFTSPLDLVTSRPLEIEFERLTAALPPIPGRAWLVRRTMEILAALCLAAADAAPDGEKGDRAKVRPVGVPVKITYRGRLRRRELTPGAFVTLVAASVPSISEAIASTAHRHGVPITIAPPSSVHRQAVAMRRIAASLTARQGRADEPAAVQPAAVDGEESPPGSTAP